MVKIIMQEDSEKKDKNKTIRANHLICSAWLHNVLKLITNNDDRINYNY